MAKGATACCGTDPAQSAMGLLAREADFGTDVAYAASHCFLCDARYSKTEDGAMHVLCDLRY
eukprot:1034650-Rhodomonas_salina.2